MLNEKVWSNLESSNWYEFIHRLLKYSCEIAEKIVKNKSVLIHCSDGWDRTAQLVSLSELLIDPYYRTIKGFAVLIEKEWLSFGHQFGLRNGIYLTPQNEEQRSPIFLQFLDCVHQIINQFPHCFEFNNELLLFLAQASTSNLYGTFLFNNENERRYYDAAIKTASVWTDILRDIKRFTNPFFEPENKVEIIYPNYATYNLVLWKDFFACNSPYTPIEPIYIDDTKKESVKSSNEFFCLNKQKDNLKFKKLEESNNELNAMLSDVLKATKDTDVFDSFDESTKKYLMSINI